MSNARSPRALVSMTEGMITSRVLSSCSCISFRVFISAFRMLFHRLRHRFDGLLGRVRDVCLLLPWLPSRLRGFRLGGRSGTILRGDLHQAVEGLAGQEVTADGALAVL